VLDDEECSLFREEAIHEVEREDSVVFEAMGAGIADDVMEFTMVFGEKPVVVRTGSDDRF